MQTNDFFIPADKLGPLYLIQGTETYLMDQARDFFLNQVVAPEDQEMNVLRLNMEEQPVQYALAEAQSLPFFGDRRVIVLERPSFLTGEKAKLDHDLDALQAYLDHPTATSILVLMAPYEKLDNRKKIVKTLKQKAQAITVNPPTESQIRKRVVDRLGQEGLTIDSPALETLLRMSGMSLSKIMKEVDKLSLAGLDQGKVTLELVQSLVTPSLDQSIFDLSQMILTGKKQAALDFYHDLLLQKEEPVKITATLVSQYRLLLQVAYLAQAGYQEPDMQAMLNIHPYRIQLAHRQIRGLKISCLERDYQALVQVDYLLKTSPGNRESFLEMYIIDPEIITRM